MIDVTVGTDRDDAVGQVDHPLEPMLGREHRDTKVVHQADERGEHVLGGGGIERGRGLVEHEHPWGGGERGRGV